MTLKRSSTVLAGPRVSHSGVLGSTTKTQLEHNANTDFAASIEGVRRVHGIICTLGPATSTVEALEDLMRAGMNIARLNFSHGSYDFHAEMIAKVRKAAENTGKLVGIALDTKGPEIRTGKVKPGQKEIVYKEGTEFTVTTHRAQYAECDEDLLYVDYENIVNVIQVGGQVFVDDGLLQLKVLSIDGNSLRVRALNTATISDHKGVNLPNCPVDLPAVSAKDAADLAFARQQGLDMVFASFIRKPDDVLTVRRALGEGKPIRIISKIENVEGCENFQEILKVTDGVMVARGDLGIEIPAEKVFAAQKMMIANCNIVGKPVICATQMLESMTQNPRPTRAEVSDVANAVLDGADCIMLSGETAKGKYPTQAVLMMARIAVQAQLSHNARSRFEQVRRAQPHPLDPREVIAQSSVNTAYEVGAQGIIVLSNTGTSAVLISKYHPDCPIFAVTSDPTNARQLLLNRGVFPVLSPEPENRHDYDARVHHGIAYGLASGQLHAGDLVVAVHSDGGPHTVGANMVRIITVGN